MITGALHEYVFDISMFPRYASAVACGTSDVADVSIAPILMHNGPDYGFVDGSSVDQYKTMKQSHEFEGAVNLGCLVMNMHLLLHADRSDVVDLFLGLSTSNSARAELQICTCPTTF